MSYLTTSCVGVSGALLSLLIVFSTPVSKASSETTALDESEVQRILNVSEDLAYGEYLAGECASCHLASTSSNTNVPVIRGASSEYLARALLEYRLGIRDNTTMGGVASALGDEEIAVLARYLATL